MGLSYYYEFSAPNCTTAAELEEFLHNVERFAVSLGFNPTMVLNVPFDTPDRRAFARRLGGSVTVQDERLKGIALPVSDQIRNHDPYLGECRLLPEYGVVLVITDEGGCETCFGFFRFPDQVVDIHGNPLADSGLRSKWSFQSFVDSPDPRFREIVERFTAAGYTMRVRDEFA